MRVTDPAQRLRLTTKASGAVGPSGPTPAPQVPAKPRAWPRPVPPHAPWPFPDSKCLQAPGPPKCLPLPRVLTFPEYY